ncbi:hypothetical protein GCM10018781_50890 [Kitasatospora indigofera]|uniref:Uncharacterized protein n=1 Tax=Kitasatospora indigofera TaxID=67307 RepID=A0A919G398_9ACTN|nr:hypothetical protein [Kitasatospora indigofera]GHH77437.1 hypothetical protein GCM10018781_50890 [Kitasatospora indigofera]
MAVSGTESGLPGTRLNSAQPADGASGGIKVNPTALRLAAGAAHDIAVALDAARVPEEPSYRAADKLRAQQFELGAALGDAAARWRKQLASVTEAVDLTSRNLTINADGHSATETAIASRMTEIGAHYH